MIKNRQYVAVTGIGIIAPTVTSFHQLTKESLSSLKREKMVQDVPVPEGQNSRELRRLSKLARMAVFASDQAIKMSMSPTSEMGIGVALSHGSTSYLAEFHDLMFSFGPDSTSPSAFSNGVTNAPLSIISTINKLTGGGITFTGFESAGIDILSFGAEAVLNGEYESFLAGAAEEYSPIIEQIYHRKNWFNGESPQFLPKDSEDTNGYAISEGSAFLIFEKLTDNSIERALALYSPVNSEIEEVNCDLIISGAGGGPQDSFELEFLGKYLQKNKTGVAFTNVIFGNCFALSGAYSAVLACACLHNRCNILPKVNKHPKLDAIINDSVKVSSVMVTGAGRDGQSAAGLFCTPDFSEVPLRGGASKYPKG